MGEMVPGIALEGAFLTRRIARISGLQTTWFEDPYGNVFILMEKSAKPLPYFRQWAKQRGT